MAEVTHLFYLDLYNNNKINTACGSNDPTDIATNSLTAVTCDECIEEMSKVKNPRPEPAGKDAYASELEEAEEGWHPDIAKHREILGEIETDVTNARELLFVKKNILADEVQLMQSKINLSLDTISRINDFLGIDQVKVED